MQDNLFKRPGVSYPYDTSLWYVQEYELEEFACPHCGEKHTVYDALYGVDYRDGEEHGVVCNHCGKDYIVRVIIRVSAEVIKFDQENEHE